MPWVHEDRVRRLTRAVLYAVAVGVPVGLLAFLVRTKFDPLVRLDQDVLDAATDYTRAHPGFRSAVETWETISQPFVMYLVLGLPVSLYVWWRHDFRTRAWWGLATMAVGWGLAALLKLVVRRARPVVDDPFGQHVGYSFPSGHATNNAIVVTVVLLLVFPLLGTALRRLLVGVGAAWVVVTCADRLFAGAHFLSDVTAGALLGCGLTLASYAGYVGWRPPTPADTADDSTKGPH
jgi:membrane-associated phospholipid phosphatase